MSKIKIQNEEDPFDDVMLEIQYFFEALLNILDPCDDSEILLLILKNICLIGEGLTAQDCQEKIQQGFKAFVENEDVYYKFLKVHVHAFASLMEGDHYAVLRIYRLPNVNKAEFEAFLGEVQNEIRKIIDDFIQNNYDLKKMNLI